MFGDADLDIFFADMGVPVVAGSQSCTAIFDAPGEAIDIHSLAPVSGVDYAITFKSSALTLASRQQITVNGQPYQVTSVDPMDDGLVTKAKLKFLGSPTGPGAGAPSITLPWGQKLFAETPDGIRTVFTLPSKVLNPSALQIIEDGLTLLINTGDFTLATDGLHVTFTTPPETGRPLSALY
jgi:hypothetical protein